MKQILLVTGYSRGIGAALVENLRKRNNLFQFIYLGRRPPAVAICDSGDVFLQVDLGQELSAAFKSDLLHVLQNLQCADHGPARAQEHAMLVATHLGNTPQNACAGLLYAAGDLGPLGFSPADVRHEARAFYVNAINFAALSRIVLPFLLASPIDNFVFHLSSGAALNAYADLATYASSKAAALMHSRCLALALKNEERLFLEANSRQPAGHAVAATSAPARGVCTRVLSVAPGTVATDMTRQLAHSDKEKYPQLQKFRDLLAQNAYKSTEVAAVELASLLFDAEKASLRKQIDGCHFDLRS